MSKIYPYFEVDGTKYEFKRNRALMLALEEIRESNEATDEQQRQYARLLELNNKVVKLSARKAELEEEYYENFDDAVGELLAKCETAYKKAADEYIEYEIETKITATMEKATLDSAERFVIHALQYGAKGDTIRTKNEAEAIWCSYVDEVGEQVASQFLVLLVNHISGADEDTDDNDFFTQAKAKAEERANNRRNGLKRVK